MRDLMHCSLLHSLLRTYERSTCSESKEKKALPESRQAFEVAAAQTSGLINLVSSRQTGFIKCEHPFIDKPMVKQAHGYKALDSHLYPGKVLRMLNKD